MPWLAWIQRAVFLLVVIGLVSAASKAAERWQAETSELKAEAERLRGDAAATSDPVTAAALEREALRHESSVPSLGNVRWDRVGVASLLYGCGLFPPGWVLHRVLRALSVACSLGRAIAAQLLGHAGKYIPGKAMVVFLRVGAILPKPNPGGVGDDAARPIGRVASCVFFETLLMMGVGGALAGILLWRSPLPGWVRLFAAAMAVGSVIPLCPPVLRRLLKFIARRRRVMPSSANAFDPAAVSWSLLAQCWVLSLISWILIGLSFAMLIAAIPSFDPLPPTVELTSVATAAISLGIVLGFASLLPGGAGVREYVTLLVLTPLIGQTHALLAVIAARLMFIIVETILAGLSAAYLRHLRTLQPILQG